jgi:branched-chain amino acid transport system substrate-binding protein
MHLRILAYVACLGAALAPLQATAADAIKIGYLEPLSGGAAVYGQPALKGAQMYVDEINAKGGVLGRKIELLVRDTKASPDEAVRLAREAILKDNADFLIGTMTSAEAPAVSTISKENKVLFVSPVARSNSLSAPGNLHPYLFRTATTTDIEGRTAAVIMAKWPVKRIVTIGRDDAYGHDVTNAFITHLKKLKPDVEIVDQRWIKLGNTEYTAILTAQMSAKPDAVFSTVSGGDFVPFTKQATPLGFFKAVDNHVVAIGDVGSIEIAQALGPDYPYGIIANTLDPVVWPSGEPAAHKEFMEKVRAYTKDKYGSSWAAVGYTSVEALVAGINKAGSTDTEKVAKAMLDLNFDTPLGNRTFNPTTHTINSGEFWGEMVKLDGYTFAIMGNPQYYDPTPFMD